MNFIQPLFACAEVFILGVVFLCGDVFLQTRVLILLWNLSHQRKVFDLYLIILFVLNRFVLQKLVIGGSRCCVLRRFWREAFGLEEIESAVGSLSQLYFIWLHVIYDLVWSLVDFYPIDLHRIVEYVLWTILLFLIWHSLELRGYSILIQQARIILHINDRPHISINASHTLRVTAGVQADLVVHIDWSIMVIIWIPDIGFICLRNALYGSNHWTKYGSWWLTLRSFSLMRSGRLLRAVSCFWNILLLDLLALSLLIIILILIDGLHSLALWWFNIWVSQNWPSEAWSLCVRIIRHGIFSVILGAIVRVSAVIGWLVDAHEARNIS